MKLKKSLFAVILFTAVLAFSYSQNASETTSALDASSQTVTETSADSGSTDVDFESSSSYFSSDNQQNDNTSGLTVKKTSTVWTIVKVLFFLIIVCAAIYFVMRFFKNKSNVSKSDDDFMRRVSTLMLAPGKSVEIVTLLDKAYLLGVTDGGINLISEITDKELIDALNINFDRKQNVSKPMNFSEVLDMFTRKNKNAGSEGNPLSGESEKSTGSAKKGSFENIYSDLGSRITSPFKKNK